MNEQNEFWAAGSTLIKVRKWAEICSEEHDREASVVAVLVRAIELATNRSVNMERMYDIRND